VEASIPNHDTAAVSLWSHLTSPAFLQNKFTNKSALQELKIDKDTYTSADEKLNVHIYGPNVAVITGSAREKGRPKMARLSTGPIDSPTPGWIGMANGNA
jgi:hypothetical protein